MRKLICTLLVGAFCIVGTSCSVTYGNKDIAARDKLSKLAFYKSSKTDVYQLYGQPSDAFTTKNGDSHWIYRYRKAKNNALAYLPMGVGLVAGGKKGDLHIGDFYFNQKGKLTGVNLNSQKMYTSNLMSMGRSIGGTVSTNDSQSRVKNELKRIGQPYDKSKGYENQLLEDALEK